MGVDNLTANFSVADYSMQVPVLDNQTGYFATSTSLLLFIIGVGGGCIQIYMRRFYRRAVNSLQSENERLSGCLDDRVGAELCRACAGELQTIINLEGESDGLCGSTDIRGKSMTTIYYAIYMHI